MVITDEEEIATISEMTVETKDVSDNECPEEGYDSGDEDEETYLFPF